MTVFLTPKYDYHSPSQDVYGLLPKHCQGSVWNHIATAKREGYDFFRVNFNTEPTKGAVPAEILAEVIHRFKAEPIGGITFFLKAADGYKLKITHELRTYQLRA